MKKNIRQRILALLLALCLFVGVMPTVAWAEEATSGKCGKNLYWSFDEATGKLTFTGSGRMEEELWGKKYWKVFAEDILTIEFSEEMTSIGQGAFEGCINLTEVYIPAKLTDVWEAPFAGCTSLTGIWVAEGNTAYCNDSRGVLFNKDQTKLIQAPGQLSGDYHIPGTVETVMQCAFLDCYHIDNIYFPASVRYVDHNALLRCGADGYWVDVNNPYLSSDSRGVLFDKNKEYIMFAPGGLTGGYIIPESVNELYYNSFYGLENLTSITINDKITWLDFGMFENCTGLKRVIFRGAPPDMIGSPFRGTTATVYYPADIAEWEPFIQKVSQYDPDHFGYITWVPYTEDTYPEPFTDVPGDKYYYEPVMWAYTNGITTGTTATTFAPNKDCTRGQIVTFLWRAAGKPEPTTTNNPFTDVEADDFYYKAVLWAVEEGITTGATATTFNPKGDCNRAQVVTFMYRAAGSPAITGTDNPFEDVPSDKYYHDAVLWAVENGITTGASATKFAPNNTCTRGQIVTFLYRGYGQ